MTESNGSTSSDPKAKSKRGFASMDPSKQREIASKGGKSAHAQGKAHQFSADEARVAGRKGGQKVASNRAHMAEIGQRGGRARAKRLNGDGVKTGSAAQG